MEVSDDVPGSIYHIYTPKLSTVAPYHVAFWYHAYGYHVGQLNVYEVDPKGIATRKIWTLPSVDHTSEFCVTSYLFTIYIDYIYTGLYRFSPYTILSLNVPLLWNHILSY